MNKPTKTYPVPETYGWGEIVEWVQYKTGRDVRDWQGKFKAGYAANQEIPYQDFWCVICDLYGLNNGSYFRLDLDPGAYEQDFCKEIVGVIAAEFPAPDGFLPCWVEW